MFVHYINVFYLLHIYVINNVLILLSHIQFNVLAWPFAGLW